MFFRGHLPRPKKVVMSALEKRCGTKTTHQRRSPRFSYSVTSTIIQRSSLSQRLLKDNTLKNSLLLRLFFSSSSPRLSQPATPPPPFLSLPQRTMWGGHSPTHCITRIIQVNCAIKVCVCVREGAPLRGPASGTWQRADPIKESSEGVRE